MDSSNSANSSAIQQGIQEAMDDFEVISITTEEDGSPTPKSTHTSLNEDVMDTTVPAPESSDLTPPPSLQIQSTSHLGLSLKKDFSMSASSLFPEISESVLKVAFKDYYASAMKASTGKGSSGAADDFEVMESPDAPTQMNLTQAEKSNKTSLSPFVTAMIQESQMTTTENNAPTFSTSDDPRLDFFFGVLEQSGKGRTIELLQDSWKAEPLDTLKLLANLRDIREGKGIRVQYQECLHWLYQYHPKTLYENLEQLVAFGYWKDVLHLLVIILFDGYMHPFFQKDACPKSNKRSHVQPSKVKIQRYKRNLGKDAKKSLAPAIRKRVSGYRNRRKELLLSEVSIANAQASRKAVDDENRIYNRKIAEHYNVTGEVSQIPGKEMQAMRLQFAREKLSNDMKYRVFHSKIAQIFASQLIADVDEMKRKKSGPEDKKEVSLAGKWAPSLEAHCDKYTLIASAIGLEIVKQRGDAHLDILTKRIPVATYLARKLYHKEYCVPLRRYLDVPEHYISAREFQKINYKRVAAKCMKKNKGTFIKHDKDRFLEYLLDPSCKVAGASLKPVELICEAMEMDGLLGHKDEDMIKKIILEKQWESLTESVKSKGGGLLRNAVAVCDVSGSMSGVPMQAAIGLTLLTMSVSEKPWNSICITFHDKPSIFNLDTSLGLVEKLRKMKGMAWGGNTDLHRVFQLIVKLGQEKKLTDDQMPKILFIFTDMEFDEACSTKWYDRKQKTKQTNFEAAKKVFKNAGYSMPAIVFWNLRDSYGNEGKGKSTPVQKNELGVCLMSGFSGQMLSYIMNQEELPGDEEMVEVVLEEGSDEAVEVVGKDKPAASSALSEMTPLSVMLGILANEKYNGLKVYD